MWSFTTQTLFRSSLSSEWHRRRIRGSGEDDSRKLFALSFLRKYKNPLPRRRISKYDAGQEIRTGTPESSDVITGEVLKLHTRELRTDTVHDSRERIFQFQPPPDPKWGAMWQEERPGHRAQIQTHRFSTRSQSYWQAPTPKRQNHRCLAECTCYYGFWYSIICYVISGFSMCLL